MIALIFAAVAILVIAWINYINLTVARSMERAKEVGVRRVVGAFRQQLIYQFLFDLGYESDSFHISCGINRTGSSTFQPIGRTYSYVFCLVHGLLVDFAGSRFIAGIFISGIIRHWLC